MRCSRHSSPTLLTRHSGLAGLGRPCYRLGSGTIRSDPLLTLQRLAMNFAICSGCYCCWAAPVGFGVLVVAWCSRMLSGGTAQVGRAPRQNAASAQRYRSYNRHQAWESTAVRRTQRGQPQPDPPIYSVSPVDLFTFRMTLPAEAIVGSYQWSRQLSAALSECLSYF